MAHPPRFVPPDSLTEVTTRTLQGRFLLRPSDALNDLVRGILARAAGLYDVGICYFVVLSNHVHLLCRPADAEQLAGFMQYFNGNLAKEAGRLHGWRQKFWSRRYKPIVVSHEPKAQLGRLRYLLEQGCKEGLVRKPADWPGATGLEALLTGLPIVGRWFDRTREYRAKRRGEKIRPNEFAEEQQVELVPLPIWDDMDPGECRALVEEMVCEIEAETRERLAAEDRSPMGRRQIERQNPHSKPNHSNRSPAPRCHAASWEVRQAFKYAWYEFQAAYREAAAKLRAGDLGVKFPPGCFPPRLPFSQPRAGPLGESIRGPVY